MHSGISVHRACFPFRFAILRKASGLHSQRTRGGIRTHIHVILSHIALPISAREHVMELQRRGLWILRATQLISPVLLFCCFSVLKPIYHSASCCATDFSVILQDSLSRRAASNRLPWTYEIHALPGELRRRAAECPCQRTDISHHRTSRHGIDSRGVEPHVGVEPTSLLYKSSALTVELVRHVPRRRLERPII